MLGALLQQRGECWIFGVSLWKSNNTIEPRINSLRVVAIDQQLKQYSGYFQGSVFRRLAMKRNIRARLDSSCSLACCFLASAASISSEISSKSSVSLCRLEINEDNASVVPARSAFISTNVLSRLANWSSSSVFSCILCPSSFRCLSLSPSSASTSSSSRRDETVLRTCRTFLISKRVPTS